MPTSVFSITATPPARYDDLPWVEAQLQQSDTETGTFTLLETLEFDGFDADPSQPATRSFTTEAATVDKWYRLVFADADGDLSEPTAPVENRLGIEAFATAAELAAILQVSATGQATALNRVLIAAAGEIISYIGRDDLAGWEVALATEVNLERAVEHWQQMKSPFGILGLGAEVATHTATSSWDRHASKLMPLKRSWGLA